MLLAYQLPMGLLVAGLPSSFLDPPPGITFLSTDLPSAEFFQSLNFVLVLAGVGLLFGWRTRLCSFLVTGCMLVVNSWLYSFGKIDHDILFVLLPLFMAVAGWGDSYSLDARNHKGRLPKKNRPWPLALFALAIGLAMFSAAFAKAATGWLKPSTQAVKAHLLQNIEVAERTNSLSQASLNRLPWVAWKLADVGTVALESAFLMCAVRRRSFQIVCAVGTLFHFGIMVLMQIYFLSNLVAYAAFCDWWKVEHRFQSLTGYMVRWAGRIKQVEVLGLGSALAALYVFLGKPGAPARAVLDNRSTDHYGPCGLYSRRGYGRLLSRRVISDPECKGSRGEEDIETAEPPFDSLRRHVRNLQWLGGFCSPL
jgi:uncharacterized membrane protein YphA (DoxX/SURF4 family)